MRSPYRIAAIAVASAGLLLGCFSEVPTIADQKSSDLIVQPSENDGFQVQPAARTAAAPYAALDFESLASTGTGYTFVYSYVQDGFYVYSTGPWGPEALASPNTGSYDYAGSTTLFNNTPDAFTYLISTHGGMPFSVKSIDIAELRPSVLVPRDITFIGTRRNGVRTEVTHSTDGVWGLETFTLSGFSNIDTLWWRQDYPSHQFDNITFKSADPTTKDECKNGAWEDFGFKNQGQCIRLVETGKDSR